MVQAHTQAEAVALDKNGKFYVAGSAANNILLLRFNNNGTPDTTWGNSNGIVNDKPANETAKTEAIALDEENKKIYVAGKIRDSYGIARYTDSGELDTSFNATGYYYKSSYQTVKALAIAEGKKLVLAGQKNGSEAAVIRLNSDGTIDSEFGNSGELILDSSNSAFLNVEDMSLDLNGNIIIVGHNNNEIKIVKITSKGELDASFNSTGIFTLDVDGAGANEIHQAYACSIDSNGMIVVAGKSANNFALIRVSSAGTLDNGLDGDGIAITDMGENANEGAYAIAIDRQGRVLLGGESNGFFAISRYE